MLSPCLLSNPTSPMTFTPMHPRHHPRPQLVFAGLAILVPLLLTYFLTSCFPFFHSRRQIVFAGLDILVPLLSPELLKFPKLCRAYFALLAHMLEVGCALLGAFLQCWLHVRSFVQHAKWGCIGCGSLLPISGCLRLINAACRPPAGLPGAHGGAAAARFPDARVHPAVWGGRHR